MRGPLRGGTAPLLVLGQPSCSILPLDVDVTMLAREANMGTSTFHHAFREVTATTPVQHVKSIRLHRARTLLVSQGLSAQDAARRLHELVPVQREYRRMFGCSPASDPTVSVA